MCLRVQQRVAGVGRSGGGEPTLSERGGSLENWLRPGGAGMGFALKYWPAMGQERERGRPWPGAHPGHGATICTVSRQIRANLNITTQENMNMRTRTLICVLTRPDCQAEVQTHLS